jgi:hypothetical protein
MGEWPEVSHTRPGARQRRSPARRRNHPSPGRLRSSSRIGRAWALSGVARRAPGPRLSAVSFQPYLLAFSLLWSFLSGMPEYRLRIVLPNPESPIPAFVHAPADHPSWRRSICRCGGRPPSWRRGPFDTVLGSAPGPPSISPHAAPPSRGEPWGHEAAPRPPANRRLPGP